VQNSDPHIWARQRSVRRACAWIACKFVLLSLLCAPPAEALTYKDTSVAMNWVDPAKHTAVTWTSGASCTAYASAPADDDITAPLNIGFNFVYGATTYTTVQIMTNGRLQFGNKYCGFGTQSSGSPPTYALPYFDANLNNTMRIYGADLDLSVKGTGTSCPAATCGVRYTATPIGTAPNRQFVVTWLNVPEWSQGSSSFNLQIILSEDGSFTYQFGSFSNPSKGSAQSGWQLSASDFFVKSKGTQSNGTAIKYLPTAVATSGLKISVASATASTCTPTVVTVSAIDGAGNVVSSYAGTIKLTTSSAHGSWTVSTATGSFSAGGGDSGTATYSFNGSGGGKDNGVAAFALSNTHADTLTISAADTVVSSLAVTSGTVSFLTNAFVVQPTDGLGNTVVAGRAHAMKAELWQKDPTSGTCSIASTYSGAKTLDAWLTRDSADPGGSAPTIGAVALPNVPSGGKGSDNITLTFSAGTATFSLATGDVGKYALNLRDDSRVFAAGIDVSGATSTVTVRPFALSLESIAAGAISNLANAGATGTVFARAGANFSATVRGVLWQSADDPSNSGSPVTGANLTDNGTAASFAWATNVAVAAPFTPASGVLGVLSNGSVAQGAYAGGRATASTLQYSEVGSASLAATASTYLNTAGLNLNAPGVVVGRFTPTAFAVATNTPVFSAGCAASGFTYVGAPFTYRTAPVMTVTALNAAGATTRNYTGSFWKLTTASLTGKSYQAMTGTLNTGNLPATDPVIVDNGNGTGTLTFSSGSGGLNFVRGAPSAPFNAELALQINVIDTDAVAFAGNPARFGAATAGNGIAFDDGSASTSNDKQMLWGRLRLVSGFGSELLPVSVNAVFENYSAAGNFVLNAADNCTPVPTTAVNLANTLQTPAAGTTSIRIAGTATSTATITSTPARLGLSSFLFSAPGAGNTGYTGLSYDLGAASTSWLQFDWSGTGTHNQNPNARADFGIFNGPRTVIYAREPW
jgi:MSHA biogenesis protein MshQ